MRRASMPIHITFILVIGVIAAFLIIGMLIDWAFNAGKMMEKITKPEQAVPDHQKVDASGLNCQDTIIKYAKLCHTKVTQEQIPAGLCYAITDCSGAINNNDIYQAMVDTFGPFDPEADAALQADINAAGPKVTISYAGHVVIN